MDVLVSTGLDPGRKSIEHVVLEQIVLLPVPASYVRIDRDIHRQTEIETRPRQPPSPGEDLQDEPVTPPSAPLRVAARRTLGPDQPGGHSRERKDTCRDGSSAGFNSDGIQKSTNFFCPKTTHPRQLRKIAFS